MAEKVTTMVLKVDLQCPKCYRKVKKVLAEFPQIRSQAFDEKKNTVTITVVCCSPEKFRDRLCCRGGKAIKSIEIIHPKPPEKEPKEKPPPPPPPPKEPEKQPPPPPPPKEPEKKPPPPPPPPKEPEKKPPPPPPPVCVPFYLPVYPVPACCGPCSEGRPGGPCYEGHGRPVSSCCESCSQGIPGGPCYEGHGRPVSSCCEPCSQGIPGGPCYEGYGRPVPSYDGYGYGGNRPCYVSRCDEYLNEENASGCAIM